MSQSVGVKHVFVPAARWERWQVGFVQRNGPVALSVSGDRVRGSGESGAWFEAQLPFERSYDGPADSEAFETAAEPPADWGILLVRKGGFAVARLAGHRMTASKVGQRHVQGRTKAGGQSQQRFARRRDNQAREAYGAAADHAARILEGLQGPVVVGGDHAAIEAVLPDPRLPGLDIVGPWLTVPDPRRAVLEQAVGDACAIQIEVENARG